MGQRPPSSARIAALGRGLGPDVLAACQQIFGEEQRRLAEETPVAARDVAYGPDERQKLDLYRPEGAVLQPVLLWVHGGGFLRGDKGAEGSPFNAHIGRWAARSGLVGAVMNYRFAPGAQWPSGVEDVAAAVDWLRGEGPAHGIDDRIVLAGTSAGAVHIAGYLAAHREAPVAGAVLLSGLYGFTPLDERDSLYYGPQSDYAERMPLDGIVASGVPLFIACAEYDPPRFQAETLGLLQARLDRHGMMPRAMIVGGHNHYTLAMHIGGSDTRLADEILAFIGDVTGVSQ